MALPGGNFGRVICIITSCALKALDVDELQLTAAARATLPSQHCTSPMSPKHEGTGNSWPIFNMTSQVLTAWWHVQDLTRCHCLQPLSVPSRPQWRRSEVIPLYQELTLLVIVLYWHCLAMYRLTFAAAAAMQRRRDPSASGA